MRPRGLAVAVLATLVTALACPAAAGADRRLAVLIDTSGSMVQSDPARFTVQLTKILADVLDERDELIVVRLPTSGSCADGPRSDIVFRMDPRDRAGFRRTVDGGVEYRGGNIFAAPIRSAIELLTPERNRNRMLLMLADSGGLDECTEPLTRELTGLRASGAIVAAVNMGRSAGDFFQNPGFTYTDSATTPEGLMRAAGAVFQRFLGAKNVQTGPAGASFDVTIDPYVHKAFVIVAADGPLSSVELAPGHPEVASVDPQGGDETVGLDKRSRAYRMATLLEPSRGRYTLMCSGLTDPAAYLVLQEYGLSVRMVSSARIAAGAPGALAFEIVDGRTGKTVADASDIPGLSLTLEVSGSDVHLRDDGSAPDRTANDGVWAGTHVFPKPGKVAVSVHLQSDVLDVRSTFEIEALLVAGVITAEAPPAVEVDSKTVLRARVGAASGATLSQLPAAIEVTGGEATAVLKDDGKDGDEQQGDGLFTGTWAPSTPGPVDLRFAAAGSPPIEPVVARVEVAGRIDLGPAAPIEIGPVAAEGVGTSALDLSGATVRGRFALEVTAPDLPRGAALEIDPGGGFRLLGKVPVVIEVDGQSPKMWAVRVRAGTCPAACRKSDPRSVKIRVKDASSAPRSLAIPLIVEVTPRAWVACYWWFLALAAAALAAGVLLHGYLSPARFDALVGVQLSSEEDLFEGFFHPFRAQRGTRSGFYRDATAYVSSDFRVSGRAASAVVRLRATRLGPGFVLVRPEQGSSLLRRNAEGDWEPLPAEETPFRLGTVFKSDSASLFFEIRTMKA